MKCDHFGCERPALWRVVYKGRKFFTCNFEDLAAVVDRFESGHLLMERL